MASQACSDSAYPSDAAMLDICRDEFQRLEIAEAEFDDETCAITSQHDFLGCMKLSSNVRPTSTLCFFTSSCPRPCVTCQRGGTRQLKLALGSLTGNSCCIVTLSILAKTGPCRVHSIRIAFPSLGKRAETGPKLNGNPTVVK